MKYISKIIFFVILSTAFVSCVEEYDSDFLPEKPESVVQSEFLNGYEILKSCVDRAANPNFKLGTAVTASDFTSKGTEYSLRYSNFDELIFDAVMNHSAIISDDGTSDFSTVNNLITVAKEVGISVYGQSLCEYSNLNSTYLNSLIAPIPGNVETGKVTVANFETDNVNDTYPVSDKGTATVVVDPEGKSGNVLNLKGSSPFSIFHITLPDDLTLNNCVKLVVDFRGGTRSGLGSGFRMAVNDANNPTVYGSPASFGCTADTWGRQMVNLDFSAMNLTDDQKELKEFDLIVGVGNNSANYYLDNIIIEWEIVEPTFEWSDEEKKQLLQDAMSSWINQMMTNCEGYVKAWDVANELISDDSNYMLKSVETESEDSTSFYWQDYLGENFVRDAVKYARQHFKETGGDENDLKLFINDYDLETYGNNKCTRLISMINQWEGDGTVIDGIATQMHVVYTLNPSQQRENEEGVTGMFSLLAATGKLIKISELEMGIVDENGSQISVSNMTTAQQTAVAEYYNFIVRKYFEIIPAAQRYGITMWTIKDSSSKVGLWNSNYNRKFTYAGFADGLAGKVTSIADK